jgi:hypothetical protein
MSFETASEQRVDRQQHGGDVEGPKAVGLARDSRRPATGQLTQ